MAPRRRSIIVDARVARNGKVAALSSDAARFALVVLWGEAKFETPIGHFNSRAHLNECMGRRARFIDEFIGAGLIHENGSGSYVVHDYDEWQKDPDPTAAERQQRKRDNDRDTRDKGARRGGRKS